MIQELNNSKGPWQAALHILARRSHSEHELRQKLYHKNYTMAEIDQVVLRLLEYGYLNDTDFANALFGKYLKMGKYSLHTVISKLKQHGIPNSIIEALKDTYSFEDQWQSALTLVTKRFRSFDAANKEKAYRFLATRGFSTAVIHKVFDNMEYAETE